MGRNKSFLPLQEPRRGFLSPKKCEYEWIDWLMYNEIEFT